MEHDIFEKIEAYIRGEMSSEEKNNFENEIAADSQLAKRLQLYKAAEETLKLSQYGKESENNLRQTLTLVHNEYIRKPVKITPLRILNKWYAAAAAVFITVLALFLFQKSNKPSAGEVYAQYAVFPALSGTRGNDDTLLSRAINYYNGNNFAAAAPLLKQSLIIDSSDIEIRLAFYICTLQNQNFAEALQGFSKIASTENVFTYQAKWYMALTFLKQGNVAASKKTLMEIPASSDVSQKAINLLKELD